jgi:hypothetical protein
MNARAGCIAVAVLLVVAATAYGQKTLGRSPAGPLTPLAADSLGEGIGGGAGSVTFEVEFSEPSGNEYLERREKGRLRVAIANPGGASVKGVYVSLNPLQEVRGVSYADSIFVGDIPANASRYAIFYFQAAEKLDPQIVTFGVEVKGLKGLLADPKLLTFLTR